MKDVVFHYTAACIEWIPVKHSVMISIKDVSFQYARSNFRLDIPDFQIPERTSVAVVGPSGSGKTTLLNLAAGILVPAAGKVQTNGEDISGMNESARRDFRVSNIGLVFQEFELLEHLSVMDNILLPCRVTSRIRLNPAHRNRATELANQVGIGDKLQRFVRKLSQGERQRVAICRALLLEPPLLLCDEPTGNLDPTNKDHVLDILFEYTQRNQATLLAVTHDHQLLERFDETIDVGQFHVVGEGNDE